MNSTVPETKIGSILNLWKPYMKVPWKNQLFKNQVKEIFNQWKL